MLLFLFFISIFQNNVIVSNEIIVEDSYINENPNVKIVKNNKNQSTTKLLEDKTSIFLRKSGGVGQKISFYVDGSTSSQVSLYIEDFEYSAPTLAYFSPTAIYFGNFNMVSIDKGIDNSSLSSHSAKINFKLSEDSYFSSFIGSYSSIGSSFNQKLELKRDVFLYFGAITLRATNNFNYIDIHKKNRVRENNDFSGVDLHFKIVGKKFKILNYFISNSHGNPGSNQFEHKEASTTNIENLLGLNYFFDYSDFNFNFKISNNYKKYHYIDKKPIIIGMKEIEYNLNMNAINSNLNISTPITDYTILNLRLNNTLYFAEAYDKDKKAGTPYITEYHPSISLKWEHFYLDESLLLTFNSKIYLEKIYQYSFDLSYKIIKNIQFNLGYKKGIRIPYLEEKYYYSDAVKGNPDLKPESSNGVNFSLNSKVKLFKYILFKLNLELYYKTLKENIIFAPLSFGLYMAKNSEPATSKGGNLNISLDSKYLSILNIFSYNNTIFDKTKNDLPQTPKYQNRLSLILKYSNYSFSTIYKYTSLYYNNIFNTDIIPKKNLIDLDFSYQNRDKNSRNYKISFKINNLANNQELYDSRHIPIMGRSYFLYFFLNL